MGDLPELRVKDSRHFPKMLTSMILVSILYEQYRENETEESR